MSGQSRETGFPQQTSYSTERETNGARSDLATRASQATADAADAALDGIDDARLKVQNGFEQQRGRAAHAIQRVSSAFQSVGEQLREEDEMVAGYLDMAGRRIDRVASYVASANPSSIADDLTDLARARPAVFFGGAFLAGLALGRFLNASQRGGSPSPRGAFSTHQANSVNRPDLGFDASRYAPERSADASRYVREPGEDASRYTRAPEVETGAYTRQHGVEAGADYASEPKRSETRELGREPRTVAKPVYTVGRPGERS